MTLEPSLKKQLLLLLLYFWSTFPQVSSNLMTSFIGHRTHWPHMCIDSVNCSFLVTDWSFLVTLDVRVSGVKGRWSITPQNISNHNPKINSVCVCVWGLLFPKVGWEWHIYHLTASPRPPSSLTTSEPYWARLVGAEIGKFWWKSDMKIELDIKSKNECPTV